jgi:hypothetical protein
LAFGVAVIGALFAVFGSAKLVAAGVAAVGVLAFATLVVWHGRVIAAEDDMRRWARVNRNAHARSTGRWRELPENGARFAARPHPFAEDLDLFGQGSLFQRISVAHTRFGEEALCRYLADPATLAEIGLRQGAVRALSSELETRQRLETLALAIVEPETRGVSERPQSDAEPKSETVAAPSASGVSRRARGAPDPEELLQWAESEPKLGRIPLIVWGSRLLPPLTLLGALGTVVLGFPPLAWTAPLLLQILLVLRAGPETARVFTAVSSTEGAFLRYGAMLELAENLSASSELIDSMKSRLLSGERRPSSAMKEFRSKVGWFDLRHNGLVHPFVNVVLLWDIHCTLALEAWQMRAGRAVRGWFQALGELEALSSLAGLAHDEPEFAFPEVVSEPAVFEASALGHPLIDGPRRVPNDVSLPAPGRALLVTGSNMSGKSTLLRAMGLAVVMSSAGAPVCATRLRHSLSTLRTSVHVSDSLERGVSHFYAELSKLKAVIDASRGPLPVFFLLDEILHGTNSRERQLGARWLLSELLQRGAIGAVSTHDLELCRLPDALMQKVTMVHFRESVQDGRMTFDYKLRSGPVTEGNALRLMRIVGLEVPLE